jgi:hypothetical protein
MRKFVFLSFSYKFKAIPLEAWTGPEGSRRLRLPDFKQSAHESGKVVCCTHRTSSSPKKYSWYSFLLEAESTPGPRCGRKDYVNDTIGNRTRDLPACSAGPLSTALRRTPHINLTSLNVCCNGGGVGGETLGLMLTWYRLLRVGILCKNSGTFNCKNKIKQLYIGNKIKKIFTVESESSLWIDAWLDKYVITVPVIFFGYVI